MDEHRNGFKNDKGSHNTAAEILGNCQKGSDVIIHVINTIATMETASSTHIRRMSYISLIW